MKIRPIPYGKTAVETCNIMAKIFNVAPNKIAENIEIFSNTHPYVRNCLYYLAKMKSEEMLLNASHSLEFLLTFNKTIAENSSSMQPTTKPNEQAKITTTGKTG